MEQRRRGLLEWGFGKCTCERCVREERERKDTVGDGSAANGDTDKADLEAELKAGLGVM